MSVALQLSLLQEIDRQLDRLTARLSAIRTALGEASALQEAKRSWQEQEQLVERQRKALRDREWEVQDGQEKISALEEKLYSGRVTNPKELDSLRRELEALKARQAKLEERCLAAMMALEEAETQLQAAKATFIAAEASWQADQARLHQEESSLLRQIAALQERRQMQAAAVDAASLATYERLRATKGGLAVASVVGNTCQGCHLSLPSSDVARIKTATGLVFCINCGRILYK